MYLVRLDRGAKFKFSHTDRNSQDCLLEAEIYETIHARRHSPDRTLEVDDI